MVKNLNDLMSLITLIFLFLVSLRLFVVAISDKKDNEKISIRQMMLNYLDNEDE